MKFKIGDKVRVRQDLVVDEEYGGVSFHEGMIRNGVYTIVSTIRESFYRFESFGYYYSAEMLELVSEYDKPTNKEIERLYEVE